MKVYGVFGDPIEHSLSPAMQNAAFEALGLEACYHAFRVKPSRLKEAIIGAKAMGFGGLNLTIPLKETALQMVQPDRTAKVIGAVNTIAFEDGIKGYNTDGIGAQKALERYGIQIRGKEVLIIGAGGAAKSIAYQLSQSEARVSIANRNPEKAKDLARKVGGKGFGLQDLGTLVPKAEIVINATSVGMKEGDPRLVDKTFFRKKQVVFDVVYNRETELLKDAAFAGAKTLDGVMMLVYQGAYALKIWTGLDAPVEAMEIAIREELSKR